MARATQRANNQTPPMGEINLFETDQALQNYVHQLTQGRHDDALRRYGACLGTEQVRCQAELANRYPPVARIWDAQGVRQDHIEFHPAWHRLLELGFSHGLHCSAWSGHAHAHVGRAAHYLLHGQVEAGTLCPMTMTSAAIPLLRDDPRFAEFVTRMHSREYDESDIHWSHKRAVMAGMGLTEKQGGSDLSQTETVARPVSRNVAIAKDEGSGSYRLTGHKWFFSSPMSDAHLVLARHDDMLSCFFVPRYRDDESRNAVHIQRLKDKVGNCSNASAEVEFQEAEGLLLGDAGRGVAQLVEMASFTRLDCVLGSTALLRQAVVQAMHHARHRRAFGRALIEQPLMRSVLIDLALESEAATALSLHLAHAFDAQTILAGAYRRILTPAAKFWVCKRAIQVVAECMEVLGGNGYIEIGPLARLYREAPVNSIWEGSGNIMCLDVLRALGRSPDLADELFRALQESCSQDAVLKVQCADVMTALGQNDEARQANARWLAAQLVLLVQAGLLRQHAPVEVADAFIASRFGRRPAVIGAHPAGAGANTLLDRAWPG